MNTQTSFDPTPLNADDPLFIRPGKAVHALKRMVKRLDERLLDTDPATQLHGILSQQKRALTYAISAIDTRKLATVQRDDDARTAATLALRSFQDDQMQRLDGLDPALVTAQCEAMGDWFAQRNMWFHAAKAYQWGFVYGRVTTETVTE